MIFASTSIRLIPQIARRGDTDIQWIARQRERDTMECMQAIQERWGLGLDGALEMVVGAEVVEWAAIVQVAGKADPKAMCKMQSRWTMAMDDVDLAKLQREAKSYEDRVRYVALQNNIGGKWTAEVRGATFRRRSG